MRDLNVLTMLVVLYIIVYAKLLFKYQSIEEYGIYSQESTYSNE